MQSYYKVSLPTVSLTFLASPYLKCHSCVLFIIIAVQILKRWIPEKVYV